MSQVVKFVLEKNRRSSAFLRVEALKYCRSHSQALDLLAKQQPFTTTSGKRLQCLASTGVRSPLNAMFEQTKTRPGPALRPRCRDLSCELRKPSRTWGDAQLCRDIFRLPGARIWWATGRVSSVGPRAAENWDCTRWDPMDFNGHILSRLPPVSTSFRLFEHWFYGSYPPTSDHALSQV
jgi:hypothetical protein